MSKAEGPYNKVFEITSHPFGVKVSTEELRRNTLRVTTSNDNNKVEGGPGPSSKDLIGHQDDSFPGQMKLRKTDICIVVLVSISVGTLAGLVWNILQTDDLLSHINELEKHNAELYSQIGTLKKQISETGNETRVKGYTAARTESSSSTTITPTTMLRPSSSIIDTTMTPKKTMKMTSPSTAPSVTHSTIANEPTSFQVIQTIETTYKGFNFLAVEMVIPSDGLSASENWCRDYENLCKKLSRRPTGCGISYINSNGFNTCAHEYNSDMNITDVLGCTPASNIAIAVNLAFPGLSPAATNQNSFGFYSCAAPNCQNTVKQSEYGLAYIRAFCQQNVTTMYTLCR